MEVELAEIRDFLAAHPPFEQLPSEVLDQLPKELTVRYLRRGTPFPPADAGGAFLYVVRKGAVEVRDSNEELIGKFGEGELFASDCLDDNGNGEGFRSTTVEDSLFYLLPCARLTELRVRYPEFAEHFNQSVRARLKRALAVLQETRSTGAGLMTVEVFELIGRPPVTIPPTASIRNAAQLMTRERVSSLLVTEESRLVGILTDRDLRSRGIAEGLDYDTRVEQVMTRRLHKIAKDTPGFEALITMTRLNVHHLPVVDSEGVLGVITSNDLIRYQSANAVYLVSDIRRARDVAALAEIGAGLPQLQVQMVAAGATGYHIGQAISSVTDAITKRLVELAEEELGPPPVRYAWLAVGSQARREQTIHSDQDHALLLDDRVTPADDAWFAELARRVSDGLAACGFFYCPGEVMATNPQWRQPYTAWRRHFASWITNPQRKALMLASNFFDMRVICGDESLYDRLHADVLHQTRDNKIFLAHMAANALHNRPPLGFFRNFVLISDGDHAQSFDLKHRGIIPITDLARVYALSAGLPEVNTCERLKASAEAMTLSQEGAADLEDAFEFIATLRARHQARQIKEGVAPDNYVRPSELSALERGHLKDAFSMISTLQNALGQRYQSGRFF